MFHISALTLGLHNDKHFLWVTLTCRDNNDRHITEDGHKEQSENTPNTGKISQKLNTKVLTIFQQ